MARRPRLPTKVRLATSGVSRISSPVLTVRFLRAVDAVVLGLGLDTLASFAPLMKIQ